MAGCVYSDHVLHVSYVGCFASYSHEVRLAEKGSVTASQRSKAEGGGSDDAGSDEADASSHEADADRRKKSGAKSAAKPKLRKEPADQGDERILQVCIHGTDELKAHIHLRHPVIKLSIVNAEDGSLMTKPRPERNVVQQNENATTMTVSGEGKGKGHAMQK